MGLHCFEQMAVRKAGLTALHYSEQTAARKAVSTARCYFEVMAELKAELMAVQRAGSIKQERRERESNVSLVLGSRFSMN